MPVALQAPAAAQAEGAEESMAMGAAALVDAGQAVSAGTASAVQAPVILSEPLDQLQVADVALAPPSAPSVARQAPAAVKFQVQTAINGASSGAITLLILSPDETRGDPVSTEIYLPLSELVALVADRMDPELVHAIETSPHIDKYVTLNELRAQGISVSFDQKDRLVLKS